MYDIDWCESARLSKKGMFLIGFVRYLVYQRNVLGCVYRQRRLLAGALCWRVSILFASASTWLVREIGTAKDLNREKCG
jgi:hypothetical protein